MPILDTCQCEWLKICFSSLFLTSYSLMVDLSPETRQQYSILANPVPFSNLCWRSSEKVIPLFPPLLPPKINKRARMAWGSCRSVAGLLTQLQALTTRTRPPEWYEGYYSINGKFHSVRAALQPAYFQGMQTFQALRSGSHCSEKRFCKESLTSPAAVSDSLVQPERGWQKSEASLLSYVTVSVWFYKGNRNF